MRKLLFLLSLVALVGCTAVDSSVSTFNDYYLEMSLKNKVIDNSIPKFRPDYIYFSQYKLDVSKSFDSELLIFVSDFKRYASIRNTILLTGYTDSDEKQTQFSDLGRKRADEVKRILVKLGIPEELFLVNDMGGKKYLVENNSARNAAKNRAVSIQVLKRK